MMKVAEGIRFFRLPYLLFLLYFSLFRSSSLVRNANNLLQSGNTTNSIFSRSEGYNWESSSLIATLILLEIRLLASNDGNAAINGDLGSNFFL